MIINLTQHAASDDQIKAGVIDLVGKDANMAKMLLTFDDLPTAEEIEKRAMGLAKLAKDALFGQSEKKAMIGGALWLMPVLEVHLKMSGIKPLYAFSRRESVEKVVDGKTIKTNVFKHIGFVGE